MLIKGVGMSRVSVGFVSAIAPSSFFSKVAVPGLSGRCHIPKRRRVQYRTRMLFEPIHTLPEFLNQVAVSCGIGFMGIAGAKATQQARALIEGDRKSEYMDALAKEIDSARRRRELADVREERDWNDVSVDRFANIYVEPEVVPEMEAYDDLEAFDKLLMDSPASKRALSDAKKLEMRIPDFLPEPSEFETEEDDGK